MGRQGGFGEGRTGAWGCRRPVHYATTRLHVPPRTALFHSTSSPWRRHPLRNPGHPRPPSGTTSHGSPVQRRTGAKYNREAPRLMSRPNKAKNRPLNNARCNAGAAAETLRGSARGMHGKGRRFFRNFAGATCRRATLDPRFLPRPARRRPPLFLRLPWIFSER